jgi:hypothetical protein
MRCRSARAGGELQRKLYCKAKAEPAFRFYVLYDKICREDILLHAYRMARANAGAPGVDGVTFAQIEEQGVEGWLAGLREELVSKTYRPDSVRRVMIPKHGGGERPLGIPMRASYCTSRNLSLGRMVYARGRRNPFAQRAVCRVRDGDGVANARLSLLRR